MADSFIEKNSNKILDARTKAKRNNAWAKSRRMVNQLTGEIVCDKEGNPLTLADMSKSWNSKKGGRNNAFSIVKRLQKAHSFECDLQAFRPKFITLTFADTVESWEAERTIQKFVDALRHWAKRQGVKQLAYFWTSEVQMKNERGALHYHILVLGLPYIAKAQIESWWSFGFVDVRMIDDIGRAFKYLAKYLWKWGKILDDAEILENDEVAALPAWWFLFSIYSKRRYGFSKWFTLAPTERMPRWVKESLGGLCNLDEVQKASRAVGGGWDIVAQSSTLGDVLVKFHLASPFQIAEFTP